VLAGGFLFNSLTIRADGSSLLICWGIAEFHGAVVGVIWIERAGRL
jgi:hypothetical protein